MLCQEQQRADTLLSEQCNGVSASQWKERAHSPSNLYYTHLLELLPRRNSISVFVPGLVPNQLTLTCHQPAPLQCTQAMSLVHAGKGYGQLWNKSHLLKPREAFSSTEFCLLTLCLYMHILTGKLP